MAIIKHLCLAPLNSINKERQAHMETLGRKFADYVLRMKLERSEDDITCGMFSILG